MLEIKSIVHPTDFSVHSQCALEVAQSLAHDHDAELHIVYVAGEKLFGEATGPIEGVDSDRALHTRLESYQPAGGSVRHWLVKGSIVDEVLRVVEDVGCNLIVMGTHGRRGLQRALLGSVAERILQRAPCPVVMVKADGETN